MLRDETGEVICHLHWVRSECWAHKQQKGDGVLCGAECRSIVGGSLVVLWSLTSLLKHFIMTKECYRMVVIKAGDWEVFRHWDDSNMWNNGLWEPNLEFYRGLQPAVHLLLSVSCGHQLCRAALGLKYMNSSHMSIGLLQAAHWFCRLLPPSKAGFICTRQEDGTTHTWFIVQCLITCSFNPITSLKHTQLVRHTWPGCMMHKLS